MGETVLLIFEGAKTEPQVFENIKRLFFGNDPNTVLVASYGNNIYNLWNSIKDDSDLDLVEVLKEKATCVEKNHDLLSLSRDQVSQVFLFFDYDGHDTSASDEELTKMLAHFSEETEFGKLYLSYPMVEAIRDFNLKGAQEPARCRVKAKEKINYKKLVGDRSKHFQIKKLTCPDWENICRHALSKGNCLFSDCYRYPVKEEFYEMYQGNIFEKQLKKYILPEKMVMILSAFPFFIVEYFGYDHFLQMKPSLNDKNDH